MNNKTIRCVCLRTYNMIGRPRIHFTAGHAVDIAIFFYDLESDITPLYALEVVYTDYSKHNRCANKL